MKSFSDIRAIYCPPIELDEKFSLFNKGETKPHKIAVSYSIASNNSTGTKTYNTTLPKIYPSEKHALQDMSNVKQPHYTSMTIIPHTNESLQEAKEKKEKKYNQNNMAMLQNIVAKNKGDKLKFKDDSDLDVGVKQANAILSTHGRLNGENKKKLNSLLHIGKKHFVKVANFCQTHYSKD